MALWDKLNPPTPPGYTICGIHNLPIGFSAPSAAALELSKRVLTQPGQIAARFNKTVKQIKDAIHKIKRNMSKCKEKTNGNVAIDPITGEVYPQIEGGGLGDSIGNLWDALK